MAEPLSTQPRIRVSSDQVLREATEAMEGVSKKYPGVVFITLVGPANDAAQLACLTTVSPQATLERLRNGIEQVKRDGKRNRIHVPFRE